MNAIDSEKVGDLSIYKMLSDETKLRILKILSLNEKCVSDLIEDTGVSQTLVSHKLKDLRENGLVSSYRSGKKIIYKLSDDSLSQLLDYGKKAGNKIMKICECVECEMDNNQG